MPDNPAQPRVPKGSSAGGEFAKKNGSLRSELTPSAKKIGEVGGGAIGGIAGGVAGGAVGGAVGGPSGAVVGGGLGGAYGGAAGSSVGGAIGERVGQRFGHDTMRMQNALIKGARGRRY